MEVCERGAGDEELPPPRIPQPNWSASGQKQEAAEDSGFEVFMCLCLSERDVSRTDRNNTFFSGNDNPGLTLLHDVLMTYCMFNFDLGQSLSDWPMCVCVCV